jgi:hypothetical protein
MGLVLAPGDGVTLLYAAGPTPVLVRGHVDSADGALLRVAFERLPAEAVPVGACVILEPVGAPGGAHALVRVQSAEERALVGLVERAAGPEKREYPRFFGAIPTEYRRSADDARAHARWMAGHELPGPAHAPDPFMNFSVLGLAFDDLPRVEADDVLLIEFRVPPDLRTFRAVARVVRVMPIPIDERDDTSTATHRIAVTFSQVEPDGAEALFRYTSRIQDAFIEGTP